MGTHNGGHSAKGLVGNSRELEGHATSWPDRTKRGTGDQSLARATARRVGGHPTGAVPVEEHSL